MRQVSDVYRRIVAGKHWYENVLVIGDGSPDSGYGKDVLIGIATDRNVFSGDSLEIGCCVSGQIKAQLLLPSSAIARKAKLRPFVRACNGAEHSEWIQKGEFYTDSREIRENGTSIRPITLYGYDAMMFAEAPCPALSGTDAQIAAQIASAIGVSVEAETMAALSGSYIGAVNAGEYSMREILGFIASAYSGCFCINDIGALQLIQLGALPEYRPYLVTSGRERKVITVGGVRIRV